MALKARGVWTGVGEIGKTRTDVAGWAKKLAEHGFTDVFPNLKDGAGRIYWPSKKFAQCVAPGFEVIDLPEWILEECTQHGIRFHAWMIDYYEGANGPAFQANPEWAARDWKGEATTAMQLRGEPYGAIWMCPARRPGYTDQWLVPLYADFAERYGVESIHHDYVRYPGDAAPDQYCFCDYCLKAMPEWAGMINPGYESEQFYHESYDREFLEAHWEQSPRVLPPNWDRLDRGSKSRFLLESSFFHGGRHDLDYFFYRFRVEQIQKFVHESAIAVRSANSRTKLSAAIFKNPIHSGRFIGQDWREFKSDVDLYIPMDYRDHYPGTFDQYLDLLQFSIVQQKEWTPSGASLWIGIAINFLFKEEPNGPYPQEKISRVIQRVEAAGAEGIVLFSEWQFGQFQVWDTLRSAFSA